MPRRGYKKNKIDFDPLYHNIYVTKLINYVMVDGKKTVARRLVYKALEKIKQKKLDPTEVLEAAVENASPQMEVRPRRVGGASYLVPVETRPTRRIFLSLNWIITGAKARSNKEYHTFDEKLFFEIFEAYQNQGNAIEKKKSVEKLAEANKAFSHFKW